MLSLLEILPILFQVSFTSFWAENASTALLRPPRLLYKSLFSFLQRLREHLPGFIANAS